MIKVKVNDTELVQSTAMYGALLFVTAIREQLWPSTESQVGRYTRIESGQALTTRTTTGFAIDGTDNLAKVIGMPLPAEAGAFIAGVEAPAAPISSACDVKIVQRRRLLLTQDSLHSDEESFAVVAAGILRGVVQIEAVSEFAALLVAARAEPATPRSSAHLPLLFTHGSASVLFHEAVGHAAEEEAFASWPDWLHVFDRPSQKVDDTGAVSTPSNLLREAPASFRRFSWRDAPLRRMTHLDIAAHEVTRALPDHYVEVILVDEGTYDSLTATITLSITLAYEVRGGRRSRVEPFRLRLPIETVTRSLVATSTEAHEYRGVICSLAGQALRVTGTSPDFLLQVMR